MRPSPSSDANAWRRGAGRHHRGQLSQTPGQEHGTFGAPTRRRTLRSSLDEGAPRREACASARASLSPVYCLTPLSRWRSGTIRILLDGAPSSTNHPASTSCKASTATALRNTKRVMTRSTRRFIEDVEGSIMPCVCTTYGEEVTASRSPTNSAVRFRPKCRWTTQCWPRRPPNTTSGAKVQNNPVLDPPIAMLARNVLPRRRVSWFGLLRFRERGRVVRTTAPGCRRARESATARGPGTPSP